MSMESRRKNSAGTMLLKYAVIIITENYLLENISNKKKLILNACV